MTNAIKLYKNGDSDKRVGINWNSGIPSANLHVNGTTNITGNLTVGGTTSITGNLSTSGTINGATVTSTSFNGATIQNGAISGATISGYLPLTGGTLTGNSGVVSSMSTGPRFSVGDTDGTYLVNLHVSSTGNRGIYDSAASSGTNSWIVNIDSSGTVNIPHNTNFTGVVKNTQSWDAFKIVNATANTGTWFSAENTSSGWHLGVGVASGGGRGLWSNANPITGSAGTWLLHLDSDNKIYIPHSVVNTTGGIGENVAFQIKNSTANTETFYSAYRTDTSYRVSFGIGSGGINRGIYDTGIGWMIYKDANQTILPEPVKTQSGSNFYNILTDHFIDISTEAELTQYAVAHGSYFFRVTAAFTVGGVEISNYSRLFMFNHYTTIKDSCFIGVDMSNNFYYGSKNNDTWTCSKVSSRAGNSGARQLFSGSFTSGSKSYNYGNYSSYVILGLVRSSGSKISVTIPKGAITTSDVSYQLADESNYLTFKVKYSGSTVTFTYGTGSSSGAITDIYGIV